VYVCACITHIHIAYAELEEDDVGASQNVQGMCMGGALFIR